MKLLVINGPNLNMLGVRERGLYGNVSLDIINERLTEKARAMGVDIEFFQSNSEGDIVDFIQKAYRRVDGILINAGGYTHTSVAIRDALLAVDIPFVEVHVSNVFSREEFRHRSLLSDIALGVVVGFGSVGYELALEGLVRHLNSENEL